MSGVTSPSVNALADDGVYLYAAGAFTNAGGTMVSCIARWDGASWTSLGSGLARLALGGTGPIAGTGAALVFNGNDLYAGGMFVTAGGKVSSGIARWNGLTTFTPSAVMCLSGPCLAPGGPFQFRGDSKLGRQLCHRKFRRPGNLAAIDHQQRQSVHLAGYGLLPPRVSFLSGAAVSVTRRNVAGGRRVVEEKNNCGTNLLSVSLFSEVQGERFAGVQTSDKDQISHQSTEDAKDF